MSKYDDIKKEIEDLIDQGEQLLNGLISLDKFYSNEDEKVLEKDKIAANYFLQNYEIWYSSSLYLIKTILPDRTDDYVLLYKDNKRKDITWKNYTISDAVQTKANSVHTIHPGNAIRKLSQQIALVKACLCRFDKKIFDMQTILQADIFDSEIDSAKHLLKKGFLRAAGAVCGVVLEKHFSSICSSRSISISKKNPTIADYNDALKDNAYDTLEWRRIQRLGDIRNLCDHNKEREPLKDEVEELISGTERVIKTVF